MLSSEERSECRNVEINVTMPCKIENLTVNILRNISYIDPKTIESDYVEIATFQHSGCRYLVRAKVEKSIVTGIDILGGENDKTACDDPEYRPVIKACWKKEGIDIDKLDNTPLSVEQMINGLKAALGVGTEMGVSSCRFTIRRFYLNQWIILICLYYCGRWISCMVRKAIS